MPLIAKNIIIGNKPMEEPKAPPVKTVSFNEIKETKPIEQPIDQYKHIEHGDLHRLFNTKSDYLRDMAALDK